MLLFPFFPLGSPHLPRAEPRAEGTALGGPEGTAEGTALGPREGVRDTAGDWPKASAKHQNMTWGRCGFLFDVFYDVLCVSKFGIHLPIENGHISFAEMFLEPAFTPGGSGGGGGGPVMGKFVPPALDSEKEKKNGEDSVKIEDLTLFIFHFWKRIETDWNEEYLHQLSSVPIRFENLREAALRSQPSGTMGRLQLLTCAECADNLAASKRGVLLSFGTRQTRLPFLRKECGSGHRRLRRPATLQTFKML